MNVRLLLVWSLAVLLSACGGGTAGPASPVGRSPSPAPSSTPCVAPCSYPTYLAVAQSGSGVVTLYASPYSGSPVRTLSAPGAESLATGLTVDTPPEYYVGEKPGTIGASAYPYTTIQPAMTTGIDDPAGIAVQTVQTSSGSAVALYVANRGAGDVAVIPLATGSVLFTLSGLQRPTGIAFDRAGNMWVSESGAVVEYAAPVAPSSQPAMTITAFLKTPSGIAFDEAGNMYVSDAGSDSVQMYSPGATTPTITISSGLNAPAAPFVANGYLYVPNTGNNTVAAFSLPLAAPAAPVWVNASGMNAPTAALIGF